MTLESHRTLCVFSPSDKHGWNPAPELSQAAERPWPHPRPLTLRFPGAPLQDPAPTHHHDLQLSASNWLL